MVKKKADGKTVIVKPSLKKPDADPEDMTIIPVTKEEELDTIPDEDPFENPLYEPPVDGEGP